jgi:O-methyltransferase involved in polyketide biosynthesis
MYGQINGIPLSDVSATMLLMLYGRVIESRSADPVLKDPKGENIVAQINDSLLHSDQKLFRRLAQFKMRRSLSIHAALRARQYDRYTLQFMAEHPGCTVVNLGCGLDTRFWRVDNGTIRLFDLDLPEVIELKRTLVQETDRYHLVARSALDPAWLDEILADGQPAILLAEGLFMYLPKPEVMALVAALGQRVTTGQLVAEVVNESYTRGFNKWVVGYKFKHELGFGQAMSYQCGITDSAELEAWSPRLHLIDDWVYFDADADKLGWYRLVGRIKAYRNVQWTVRYRIGD